MKHTNRNLKVIGILGSALLATGLAQMPGPSRNPADFLRDPPKPLGIPGPFSLVTIGDLLYRAGISWKWYSGGWDAALESSPSNPVTHGVPNTVDPLFQWHHQPSRRREYGRRVCEHASGPA